MAGLDERLAASKLAALDRRQVHCDALAGLGFVDGLIVDLDASNANRPAVRLQPQQVTGSDRAGPERPGDDRTDPSQRESSVDPEASRREPLGPLDGLGGPRERCAKLI